MGGVLKKISSHKTNTIVKKVTFTSFQPDIQKSSTVINDIEPDEIRIDDDKDKETSSSGSSVDGAEEGSKKKE